jgi:hypothetical protein
MFPQARALLYSVRPVHIQLGRSIKVTQARFDKFWSHDGSLGKRDGPILSGVPRPVHLAPVGTGVPHRSGAVASATTLSPAP